MYIYGDIYNVDIITPLLPLSISARLIRQVAISDIKESII